MHKYIDLAGLSQYREFPLGVLKPVSSWTLPYVYLQILKQFGSSVMIRNKYGLNEEDPLDAVLCVVKDVVCSTGQTPTLMKLAG